MIPQSFALSEAVLLVNIVESKILVLSLATEPMVLQYGIVLAHFKDMVLSLVEIQVIEEVLDSVHYRLYLKLFDVEVLCHRGQLHLDIRHYRLGFPLGLALQAFARI